MPAPTIVSLDAFASLLATLDERTVQTAKRHVARVGSCEVLAWRVTRTASQRIKKIELDLEHAASPLVLAQALTLTGQALVHANGITAHVISLWAEDLDLVAAGAPVQLSPSELLPQQSDAPLVDLLCSISSGGPDVGISALVYGRKVLAATPSNDGMGISITTERQNLVFEQIIPRTATTLTGIQANGGRVDVALQSESRNAPLQSIVHSGKPDPRMPLDRLARLIWSNIAAAPSTFKAHINGALVIGVEAFNTPESELLANPAPHLGATPWVRITTRDQSIFVGACLAAGPEHFTVSVLDQTGGAPFGPRAEIHFVEMSRPVSIQEAISALTNQPATAAAA